ncbi:MAG TPA: 6-phosphogluconolactonase [Candidatus Dormibacteraeota bacterium]
MQAQTFPDAEAVAAAAAELVRSELAGGARLLVLAGGTTPRRCYELLAEMPGIEWGRVSVLFGDERCVPPSDAESNYQMAFQSLLSRVHPATVYRMPAELGAEAAAAEYSRLLARLARLDLVLLGIGEDGHTASLFPGHPQLQASSLAIPVHDAPKPPPDRVSLSLRTLRAARRVVILATGRDKAEAVRLAREGSVPSGMIPRAEWLLDQEAASAD